MNPRHFKVSLMALLLSATSICAVAGEDVPQVTLEGLELVKDSKLSLVYAEPGVDLSHYNRINLADTYVSFRKNWQTDKTGATQNGVSGSDMDRIKIELSDMFREVFSEVLEDGGYELVTERAEDVLLLKPAIIKLDVNAPDSMTANGSHSYTESAGEMTLYLELYDSVTDDLIAKALDRQKDRQTGYIQWQSGVTNRAAATRILKVWANVLKNGLDEARAINKTN